MNWAWAIVITPQTTKRMSSLPNSTMMISHSALVYSTTFAVVQKYVNTRNNYTERQIPPALTDKYVY